MQWLQHNFVWIALVLAIIAIFFIIARVTRHATIHEKSGQYPQPEAEEKKPSIIGQEKE